MEFFLYWGVTYLFEFLKLYLLCFYIFNNRIVSRKKYVEVHIIFILVLGAFLIFINIRSEFSELITYVIGILAIIHNRILIATPKKLLEVIIYYLGICVVDMILAGLLAIFLNISIDKLLLKDGETLIFNSISLLVILFIEFIKRIIGYKNQYKNRKEIEKKEATLIISGMLGVGIYIAALQIYGTVNQNKVISLIILITTSLFGIALVVITSGFLVARQEYKHYKEMYRMTNELMNQQQNYYKQLLEKDIATKKFRHDIENHLYCISNISKMKKYEELDSYINDLVILNKELKMNIHTGNEFIDIVANDILGGINKEEVDISWIGLLPMKLKLSEIDLCSLFANLLKNAVEGICCAKSDEKAGLTVEIKQLNNSLVINIYNTCNKAKILIEKGKLITSKKNNYNHGFGTEIIADIVRKYGGDITYIIHDKTFQVEIVFMDISIH